MPLVVFIKGLAVGLVTCVPIGPIGILCVRRTLIGGAVVGLVSILGASTADVLYSLIAGLGVTRVSRFLIQHRVLIQLAGSLLLVVLGSWVCLADPLEHAPQHQAGGLFGAYTSTIFLMLANPVPILVFAAAFTAVGIHGMQGDHRSLAALVAGVFLGSALWSPVLVAAVSLFRLGSSHRQLRLINRVSGIIIFAFGALLALRTLMR